MATGIETRHRKSCTGPRKGGRCCSPTYRAIVWSVVDERKVTKTFKTYGAARSWRAEAKARVDGGELRASAATTVREAANAWLEGAKSGKIRPRSGQTFKPSTIRGYEQALKERVLPRIGAEKLAAIRTVDLQRLVERWQEEGHEPSTIRNTIKPLQAIYRRAKVQAGLAVNPTRDLELPMPAPEEVEIVSPAVAARLLKPLTAADRAIWATALYAGLRYGELRALRWGAVDVGVGGVITVRESWDPAEGSIEPKTRSSCRSVPIPAALRAELTELRLDAADADDQALVFGIAGQPFHAATIYRRADKAWKKAKLGEKLRLHQCRHTYASFMIAAGVGPKHLSTYMGHSSIKVTFDLYGHLMPGSESESAKLLDKFLARTVSPPTSPRPTKPLQIAK